MIITKTPLRISFFGGGSDYPSWYKKKNNFGEVLSCTIDKYIYISLKDSQKFSKFKYLIKYSKIEKVNEIKNIRHPVIKNALKYFKIKKYIELHSNADIPAKAGMGTSSAFTVGLIKAIYGLNNKTISRKELANLSTFFEHKIIKENVGSQDQFAASYGGFNNFKFFKNKTIINNYDLNDNYFKNLNQNLFLFFTGQTKESTRITSKFTPHLNKKKKIINKLIENVQTAKKIIKKKELDSFGYLLDETWNQKKQIDKNITNQEINFYYDMGKKYGALGGKLLGAGGRGFILYYVPKKNQEMFIRKFKKQILPFNFTADSSEIILKN